MAGAAPKVGLLMRGWNEIPEVMATTVLALVGVGIGTGSLWYYYKKDGDHKKYKLHYTVIRPDDPRVATIRKHSNLDD